MNIYNVIVKCFIKAYSLKCYDLAVVNSATGLLFIL